MNATKLPERSFSYVVDGNGEPMLVFFKPNLGLFTDKPIVDEQYGYFLNIRRPLQIDAGGKKIVTFPAIPNDCDGIIVLNYCAQGSNAFIVKNYITQTMKFPL